MSNMRCSCAYDDGGVDAGGVYGNLLYKGVGEDVLSDRDGECSSEGVEENGEGV